MRILRVILCPLRHAFIMIYAIVVIHVVQLPITQEAQLGAAATEVAMAIVHVAEGRCAPIMWAVAHVCVMALALT
jgi:hypothetical protein